MKDLKCTVAQRSLKSCCLSARIIIPILHDELIVILLRWAIFCHPSVKAENRVHALRQGFAP